MNRLAIAALAMLCLAGMSAPVAAQTGFGQPFGEIYFAFDVQDRNSTCVEAGSPDAIPTFVPFDFFLVVNVNFEAIGQGQQNATNGIDAWEVRVITPPEITLAGQVLNPSTSINVGGPGDWIVGTGGLITAASMPFAVVNYSGILLQDVPDLEFSMSIPSPSSFDVTGGPGAFPGWLEENGIGGECINNCLRPFTGWDGTQTNANGRDGCAYKLVVNKSTPCDCVIATATTNESWGAVKSRF